jgi:hypothetical protein
MTQAGQGKVSLATAEKVVVLLIQLLASTGTIVGVYAATVQRITTVEVKQDVADKRMGRIEQSVTDTRREILDELKELRKELKSK